MSERRTRDALDEIAEYANDTFSSDDEEDEVDPYEVFTEVFDGAKHTGEVQPLGGAELYSDSREKILNGKHWGRTYGLDAGVFPRTYEFVGGAKMNVANAVLGRRNGKQELTNHRTLVATLFKDTGEPQYDSERVVDKGYEYNNRNSRVIADSITVPEPSEGGLTEWVNKTARTFAESRHFLEYVDEIDGALFIDGPIYPPGIAHSSIFARNQRSRISDEWGDCVHDILHTYGNALEKQILSGNPVFGIVKTVSTKEVRQSIFQKATWVYDKDEEIRLPWQSDYSFFSDLLFDAEKQDQFTHTSWMVRGHRTWDDIPHQVFAQADLEELEPHDLARAFFYLRLPTGEVFRIETPACMVRSKSREERDLVKQYALWEVAKTQDTAQSIKNADSDAGLSRDLRDRIIDKMGDLTQEQDYNRDRRWTEIDYTGDN